MRAIARVRFHQHVGDVVLDRALCNAQRFRDLAIAEPGAREAQDLELALGWTIGDGRCVFAGHLGLERVRLLEVYDLHARFLQAFHGFGLVGGDQLVAELLRVGGDFLKQLAHVLRPTLPLGL